MTPPLAETLDRGHRFRPCGHPHDDFYEYFGGRVFAQELYRAEESFISGEQLRQAIGLQTLTRLLALQNKRANETLGIAEMSQEFNFATDWLQPTGEHPFRGEIEASDGSKIEIIGTRVQVNVIDREAIASKAGLIAPTGGGTRVKFVPGEFIDGVWTIPDKDVEIATLTDEGSALAAAMVPKNTGLNFPAHLASVLRKINQEDLMPKVGRFFIGGGAKADILVALPRDVKKKDRIELVAEALNYHQHGGWWILRHFSLITD